MGFFSKLFGLADNNEKPTTPKVQKPVKTPKKKSALNSLNDVDIIVSLEKKDDTIYAYDLNGERMYKISSTARKRAYKNGNYLGKKTYKSGTVRWVDVDGEKVKNESRKNEFRIQHLPPTDQTDHPVKKRSTGPKEKTPSVTKKRPTKKKTKTKSKGSSNTFVRKLERERKEQAGELASKNREADRYNTSQMRGTLLSLVEGIRKNIILNYSIELLGRLSMGIIPSATENKNIKRYFKSEDSILNKTITEHKKESARYAPCLVKSQLDNVIGDQDNNRSLIKMNEVFLSKLMNDSIPNYAPTLKKKINADKKESTKYAPCMHKTIIDLRTLISQCTLGLVEHWGNGNGAGSKNIPQLKKAITQDKKEIANYKPSHYQFLLEFRKSVHTDQLLECYKNKGAGGSATLLKDLKLIKNKYARESKKYAPCTHKYLLSMVAEYNDYLIKTYA